MSMTGHECMELVWESGQLLRRGLSTSRSCSSTHPSHPIKNVNEVDSNSGYGYTTKRPRLGAGDSILGLDVHFLGDRERDKSLQEDHHPELFHGLCEANFNMFFENNENNIYDHKHMITEAHVVPEFTNANWRRGNASEFVAEVPQLTAAINGQQVHHSSSLQKRDASVPILSHGLPNSKLQQVDSGPNNHLGLHNFSPILRPALPKPNYLGSDATRPASGPSPRSSRLHGQQLKTNADEPTAGGRHLDESGQMVPTRASKAFKYLHDQQDLLASQIVPILPVASPPEASPPDEQSEAVLRTDAITSKRCCDRVLSSTSSSAEKTITKGKSTGGGKSIDTSVLSGEASNYPASSLERRSCEEDTEGTAYTSDDDVEEDEQVPSRGSAGSKRRREGVHNLCERRRLRDKINKKMRALQDLIPTSNNVDKASMLDEAINYIKSLQLQLQVQMMRSGLCMPPVMFPTGMQPMMVHAVPQLAQFSPMGSNVGMDHMMRSMTMGVGTLPFPASAMFGLPAAGQMLPISVSQAPFIPLNNIAAGHSTQYLSLVPMAPAMSGMASTPLDLPRRSAAFSSSNSIIQDSKTLAHQY